MSTEIRMKVVVEADYKYLGYPLNYAQLGADQTYLDGAKSSSRILELRLKSGGLDTLKLTNSGAIYWDDFWVDSQGKYVDPGIISLELQNSITLRAVNVPYERMSLERVNLAGCKTLRYVNLSKSPNLKELNLDRCLGLKEVYLGFNKSIHHLSLRHCALDERSLEQLLAEYIPTKSESKMAMGTNSLKSLIDLRGNVIPWENRRIASKIRLLLYNNIGVAWSNNPPERIIPLELYRTF